MTLRTPNRARLTPGYVHSMSFRVARLGRRGLDEDDVQDFCARVEDELARLLEERAMLYAEVRRLRGRAQARNRAGTAPAMPLSAPATASSRALPPARPTGPAGSAAAGPQESNVQAVRILAKAQQTAERCVAGAQAYSREVAHDAQRRRERILAEASARATVLVEQAHRAATRIALGRPAPDPDQLTYAAPTCADPLTDPDQASYPDPAAYADSAPYADQAPHGDQAPHADQAPHGDQAPHADQAPQNPAPLPPYPRPPADDSGPTGGYPGGAFGHARPTGDYPAPDLDHPGLSDYPGPGGDYPGPAAGYPEAAIDYPGPAADYPSHPAGYPETAAGRRRRNSVRYDRFPF